MTLDNDIDEVFDPNLSYSNDDDDIHYHELYDLLVNEKKDLKIKIVQNDILLEKIKQLEK